jgi:hypothetical protein
VRHQYLTFGVRKVAQVFKDSALRTLATQRPLQSTKYG